MFAIALPMLGVMEAAPRVGIPTVWEVSGMSEGFGSMANDRSTLDIVVYWRPGCMFCSALFRQLDKRGVPHRRVNIAIDPIAAAQVRALAEGNETVPTVTIGASALVNPDIHAVFALAGDLVPDVVPEDYQPPQPGRFGRWLQAKLSGAS